VSQIVHARRQCRVLAARPKQVRKQQQQHRRRTPVELEPANGREEMAVAVHVGIDDIRHAAIQIQAVLKTVVRQLQHRDEKQHDEEMAEIFLIDEHMDRDSHRREYQIARPLQQVKVE